MGTGLGWDPPTTRLLLSSLAQLLVKRRWVPRDALKSVLTQFTFCLTCLTGYTFAIVEHIFLIFLIMTRDIYLGLKTKYSAFCCIQKTNSNRKCLRFPVCCEAEERDYISVCTLACTLCHILHEVTH